MNQDFSKTLFDLDHYLAREKRLRSVTWVAAVLPIVVFVAFVFLAAREMRKFANLRQQNAAYEATLAENRSRLEEQKKQLATKDLALTSVREARSGPAPKVTYYRSS